MSYTRNFTKKIDVHYSCDVDYPASEHGGTTTYHGIATEIVSIEVTVDTNPFDQSVISCNNMVNTLTSSVAATEAAQIVSINKNAEKVGNTIINGFFNTIRLEIDQQIVQLNNHIKSTLLHLREFKKCCIEKQKQMERDYHNITSRYLKIFEDLNHELSNRIHQIDKPVFSFAEQCQQQQNRTIGNDMVSTVAIFGNETGELQARISASVTKKRTLDAIGKANTFLLKQKQLEHTVNKNIFKENIEAIQYAPICLVETHGAQNQIDKKIYTSDLLANIPPQELTNGFQHKAWGTLSDKESSQISRYFNAELNQQYSDTDTHTSRIRENILKLLNFNHIKSL